MTQSLQGRNPNDAQYEPFALLSNGSSPEPDELLRQSADVDIAALQTIVSTCFHTQCRGFEPLTLDAGSYARAFLFSLENGIQVVGRVMLPVRESIKTEAEVAAIELVRGIV